VESIEVNMMWGENLPYRKAHPERWVFFFLEERQSNFLCMLVFIFDDRTHACGLVLRRLPDEPDGIVYVRMYVFESHLPEFFDVLCVRLQTPPGEFIDEDTNLSVMLGWLILSTMRLLFNTIKRSLLLRLLALQRSLVHLSSVQQLER